MKRRERRRPAAPDAEIEMTPMIDVVFQLLIYFLVTFSTPDILATLDVSRPSAGAASDKPLPKMIRVNVLPGSGAGGGYEINGRSVTQPEMRELLGRLGSISEKQSVQVVCDPDSSHEKLVAVLDVCAEHRLTEIAVLSGGRGSD